MTCQLQGGGSGMFYIINTAFHTLNECAVDMGSMNNINSGTVSLTISCVHSFSE